MSLQTDTFYNISSQILEYDEHSELVTNKKNISEPVIKIPILDPIHQEYLELELDKYFPIQYISDYYFYFIPNFKSLELLLIIKFKIPFRISSRKLQKYTRILMIDLISRKCMTNLETTKTGNFESIPNEIMRSYSYLKRLKNPNDKLKNSLPDDCFSNWKQIFRDLSLPKYFLKYNSILEVILEKNNKSPTNSNWFHLSQLPDELILIIFSFINLNQEIWINQSLTLNQFSPRNTITI